MVVVLAFDGSRRRSSPSAFISTLLLLLLLLEIDEVDSTVLGSDGDEEGRLNVRVALEAGQLQDGDGFDEMKGTVWWVVWLID